MGNCGVSSISEPFSSSCGGLKFTIVENLNRPDNHPGPDRAAPQFLQDLPRFELCEGPLTPAS